MCPATKNIPTFINDSITSTKVVTGTFLKAGPGTRTGINVARRNSDDAIIISRIQPGTMASTTPLKPGMRLLSINDNAITHLMTCQEVADLLINASGVVKILASPGVAGAIFKATPETKTGVTVGQTTKGKIFISRIAPYSLAAIETPQLREGMPIEAINNVSVEGMSCREVADLLLSSHGVVTIAARHNERIIV
jgi:PDZ domain